VSFTAALNPSAGWVDLFGTLASFLVLCLGVLLMPRVGDWRERLLQVAAIATLVTVVVGGWPLLPLVADGWPSRRSVEEATLEGMMSNVNLLAGYLLLLVPWCGCGVSLLAGGWRLAAGGGGLLATTLLLVLQSRAAWIGAAAAGAVTVATLMRHRRELAVSPGVWRLLAAMTVAAGVAGIGIAGLMLTDSPSGAALRTGLVHRPHQAAGPSDGGRSLVWSITASMIADHPLIGIGAGNFPVRFHEYIGADRQDLPTDFSRLSSDNWIQPHNDVLRVFAERGILGGIPFLAVFGFTLLAIRRVLLDSPSAADARLATASLAAIVGVVVFSCFDFPLSRISHQVVLAVHLAVVVLLKHAIRPASTRPLSLPCWLVMPPLLAAVALGLVATAAAWRQEAWVMAARRAEHDGDWHRMRDAARQAATPWKTLDPLAVPVAFLEGSAELRLGDLPAATACFEQALAANPNRLYILQNLGAAYAEAGRFDDAIAAFTVAAERYPYRVEVRHNLAAALIDAGRYSDAIAVIEDVPAEFRTPGMQEALEYAREQR
jgi:O-antigen ligase